MGEMKNRMLRGGLYIGGDDDTAADYARAKQIPERHNGSRFDEQQLRDRLLAKLLGACGDSVHVRPPFRLEYGYGVGIGAGSVLTFSFLVLGVMFVTIGGGCQE